jgi:hypothetical protein
MSDGIRNVLDDVDDYFADLDDDLFATGVSPLFAKSASSTSPQLMYRFTSPEPKPALAATAPLVSSSSAPLALSSLAAAPPPGKHYKTVQLNDLWMGSSTGPPPSQVIGLSSKRAEHNFWLVFYNGVSYVVFYFHYTNADVSF